VDCHRLLPQVLPSAGMRRIPRSCWIRVNLIGKCSSASHVPEPQNWPQKNSRTANPEGASCRLLRAAPHQGRNFRASCGLACRFNHPEECFAAIAIALFALAAPANAKGCIKGALVGGVAGHVAGHHGVLGAAAGCAIGHHEAGKQKNVQPTTGGAPPPSTSR
jgi:hypothetical protein